MRAEWLRTSAVCLCSIVWAGTAVAEASLPVAAVAPKQLRVDGDLGDWRGAHFSSVGERLELALGYDSSGLYVAARVIDASFVRSAHPSEKEDALVLRLALPGAGSWRTSELWMFAGKPGESPASAQLTAAGSSRLTALKTGVAIVEAPLPKGYALEAFVPWASVDAAAARDSGWRFARAAARLHDVDRAGQTARDIPAAAATLGGAKLPWLAFDGGPVEALRGLFEQRNLGGSIPALDWVGDVRDDAQPERVLVIGTHVVLSGVDASFTFTDLPVTRAADVRSAQLLDLTGDAKPELVLRLHSDSEQIEREVWTVVDLRGPTPRVALAIETNVCTREGASAASIAIGHASPGQPAPISVRAGAVRGLTADNFSETPVPERVAIPLPWGPWLERVYAWDGQRFALRSEQLNKAQTAPALVTTTPSDPDSTAPARPVPPTAAALVDAYRTSHGVGASVLPRFEQQANLAGDARPEWLGVFARDCVIVGEGFRGGRAFFYFSLPAHDARDVLRVFTADLTGDGRHELLARIKQPIGDVIREILYVYTFSGEQLEPLTAIEVSRAQGERSIENQVALISSAGRHTLQVTPGRAHGWSSGDYPFSSDSHDGVAPLLLPWKDRPLRYEFDGQQLVPRVTN